MSDAVKPALHGRDHCPGGTDPIPCLTPPYCYMDWNGPEAVTVNTLTELSTLLDYEEAFTLTVDSAGFSADRSIGVIQWSNPGEYYITGWAQFDGSATAGSTLGVALTLGNAGVFSTFRIGNHIVADNINETFRIPVSTPVFSFNPGVFGHDSVQMSVYHSDAGGQDINSARLHVVRLSGSVEGTFDS